MTESEQRQRVVSEARSWIGTPYHHAADLKGIGVDCGMLLVRVYSDAGIIEPFDPRPYPADWNLHRSEERYLEPLTARSRRLPSGVAPGPGDAVVWLHGRTFSHGGVVTDWPRFVHAYHISMIVEESDYDREVRLQFLPGARPRPMLHYSPWGLP